MPCFYMHLHKAWACINLYFPSLMELNALGGEGILHFWGKPGARLIYPGSSQPHTFTTMAAPRLSNFQCKGTSHFGSQKPNDWVCLVPSARASKANQDWETHIFGPGTYEGGRGPQKDKSASSGVL